MSPIVAFILGLLIGWLIEWVIDVLYWRQRVRDVTTGDSDCQDRLARMKADFENIRADNEWLQNQLRMRDSEIEALRGDLALAQKNAAPLAGEPLAPMRSSDAVVEVPEPEDDLRLIDGIDEERAARLREAGITSFAGLGALWSPRLRAILGVIPGVKEADMIKQARMRAGLLSHVDDLELVDGIGPVIARMLNEQGLFTFADVAALSPQDLRELLGERIERLANEEKILAHARTLAGQ